MPSHVALREDLQVELRGATVLLLGAGGAGRTAALKLASEGVAGLFLVNRTRSKAEEIAGEIRKQFPSVKVSTALSERRRGLGVECHLARLEARRRLAAGLKASFP